MIPTGHFRFLEGHEKISHYYSRILNFENILHFRHIVISFAYLIRNCTYIANNLLTLYLIHYTYSDLVQQCHPQFSAYHSLPLLQTISQTFSSKRLLCLLCNRRVSSSRLFFGFLDYCCDQGRQYLHYFFQRKIFHLTN